MSTLAPKGLDGIIQRWTIGQLKPKLVINLFCLRIEEKLMVNQFFHVLVFWSWLVGEIVEQIHEDEVIRQKAACYQWIWYQSIRYRELIELQNLVYVQVINNWSSSFVFKNTDFEIAAIIIRQSKYRTILVLFQVFHFQKFSSNSLFGNLLICIDWILMDTKIGVVFLQQNNQSTWIIRYYWRYNCKFCFYYLVLCQISKAMSISSPLFK